jgi:hypothetical protein
MTRDDCIVRHRRLVGEGERLQERPSLAALRTWLQLSDDLLTETWGSMDRYHLAWLMVGKPKDIVRGRPMTGTEEDDYVREVADQKTAALRMSLDAIERQRMPFRGESGGVGAGQGMGEIPASEATPASDSAAEPVSDEGAAEGHAHSAQGSRRTIPLDPELAQKLEEARREAALHEDHGPRAPRPERLRK